MRCSVAFVLLLFAGVVRGLEYDLVIYGATPGGIMAAAAASELLPGPIAVLQPWGSYFGGMVAGGLGHSDVGDASVIGGLAARFGALVGAAYGRSGPVWDFEPHVASGVLQAMLRNGSGVVLLENATLEAVSRRGSVLSALQTTQGVVSGKAFVDATYEGDLLALAGVSTRVGRESRAEFGESWAGREPQGNPLGGHEFHAPIPHTFANGSLFPMIQARAAQLPPVGAGDKLVQAYNFRLCVTNNASNRLPFPPPRHYDPQHWALLRSYMQHAVNASTAKLTDFLILSPLPNAKFDMNNNGPISTDCIGCALHYPDTLPGSAQRDAIVQAHVQVRAEVASLGLARDEFVPWGGFSPQLYVREARRMVGDFVFTQLDRTVNRSKPDSVGLGSYNSDCHNTERFSNGSWVFTEGDIEQGHQLGHFQIPYRALLPQRAQAQNLIAPVPLSATHIGFGAIRLEPQWMILGHSAGTAAALAIQQQQQVDFHALDVQQLQATLRKQDQIIDL